MSESLLFIAKRAIFQCRWENKLHSIRGQLYLYLFYTNSLKQQVHG